MAGEELRKRLVDVPGIGDCFVGTIHAFANKILRNSGEEYKLYSEEIQDQFMNVLISIYGKFLTMDKYLIYKDLHKKIDLGILDEHEISNMMNPSEMYEINVFMGLIDDEKYPENIKTLCKKHNIITFDELLKRTTTYFKEINGKVEYLFVDEFQDIGPLEKRFFQALNADNYFYIGDEKQCQPAGTKITMSDGSIKNIEDLKIGDEVLSYNLKEGHYCRNTRKGKGKKILDISTHFESELIQVITNNNYSSLYTKNHRCLARIHYEGNENKSVVYIMQNAKGQYRVGSTKLFTFNDRNFGLRARMNTEKATKGWILDVYENENDAWLAEQICAYKYGIPQVTWTYKNIKNTKEDIDNLYSRLGDNLEFNVVQCLKAFGRSINYPLFVRNTNQYFSKIHLTEVVACNLISSVMDLAVPQESENNRLKNQYYQIQQIVNIQGNLHKVYGLKIEDTETYVADGILTHNSLYGFKRRGCKLFS